MNPNAIHPNGQKIGPLVNLSHMQAEGTVQVAVVQNGRVVREFEPQKNLILDQGLNNVATRRWIDMIAYCVAGTGTTPTKDVLDGTWSQTGTTVGSSGSTYTLTSGDVGKWVGFADGSQAKITALINGTSVTVDRTQTVASQAANLYRANQVGLAAESKRSSDYPEFTMSDGSPSQGVILDAPAQKITLRNTFDFSAEVGAVNYTEIGMSHLGTAGNNLFARVLLAGAVSVASGQQLRVTYNLALTIANLVTRPVGTLAITGWPTVYNLASITASGTAWTVTTATAHHFVTGGKVNISGSLPVKTAITAASSTGSEFTLTTGAAHGKAPGDSITIDDMTPPGYNGTWTCAAGTTGSTVIVTTTANPGTASAFGTLRFATPATWFDGEWTIASTPTSTSFTIAQTSTPVDAGNSGTCFNNLKAIYCPYFWGSTQRLGSGAGYVDNATYMYPLFASGNVRPFMDPQWPVAVFGFSDGVKATPALASGGASLSGGVVPSLVTVSGYTAGDFYVDNVSTFSAGVLNYSNLRSFLVLAANNTSNVLSLPTSAGQAIIQLEEPQKKVSTHRLVLTLRRSWGRIFS